MSKSRVRLHGNWRPTGKSTSEGDVGAERRDALVEHLADRPVGLDVHLGRHAGRIALEPYLFHGRVLRCRYSIYSVASPESAAYLAFNPVTTGYPVTPIGDLVDQLVGSGVRVVRNGVHGDDTRYEEVRYLPTWSPTLNQGEFDVGPLGALEVDQGLDRFHARSL